MDCDICGQKGDLDHPLHCITCARAAVETPRIELAKALIDRDAVGKHVQAVVEGLEDIASQHVSLNDSRGGLLIDRYECTKSIDLQRSKTETVEINERIQHVTEQAALLRKRMEATKKQLEEKRIANAQRKSDLSSATYGIDSRRANELDKVRQWVNKTDQRSDYTHQQTVETRSYLCNTAATLAGLKVTRRRSKDGAIKEVYNIGPGSRLRIPDLRNLHEAQPDNISASLGAVANLLVRVSAYLGIRLPAEITLPHVDYPLATIFQPASSYQGKRVPFPGSTPSHSSSNSPETSRTLESRAQLPKPRTLFVDRPVPHLQVEDPREYSLFIEGVALLAYNIAWLSRTQGRRDDFNTWEDVSPMGYNLWRLLIHQETRKPQAFENHTTSSTAKTLTKASVRFGEISHATSHSFMQAGSNAQYIAGWKLSPTKITDELKAYLIAEQQAQEWDVVSQKEWEDMENIIAEDPVVVGEKRKEATKVDDSRNIFTTTAGDSRGTEQIGSGNESARGDGKKKGTSGWTKVKSRSTDAVKEMIPE
ncbi:hypothetical protein EJ04DRAFT_427156 [Polyplosphaeria fusca]|uniref:Autophagy-related protein 14 n=1 Tax=Polyplosphaeria fusca TaxID=682080 RepID=A0A9P4R4P4_9PLEO|nr:hypothetical protein EJ04DRAFT_427156 [Polyplosphaeria fusca]